MMGLGQASGVVGDQFRKQKASVKQLLASYSIRLVDSTSSAILSFTRWCAAKAL